MNTIAETDPEFDALLDFVRKSRGFDFTTYKRASLVRRVSVRMGVVGIPTIGEYIDFLQVHPDETTSLFNTILINVTSFFRDPETWQYLADQVLPQIIADKAPGESIRIWSAGCASGEEACTLAMLLAESLGTDRLPERVKIYATDADEEVLQAARHGTYSPDAVTAVPEELRSKYFETDGANLVFRPDLRRAIIFGRHDLTRDAPISRLDLLVSRNTLMYFNAEAQKGILSRFHFAIGERGFLFLGRAEMLLTHTDMFRAVDLRHRLFQRVTGAGASPVPARPDPVEETSPSDTPSETRLRLLAFDDGGGARLVIDAEGCLVAANREARATFLIREPDIGRAFRDLELSYRPLELRSLIHDCQARGKVLRRTSVEMHPPEGDTRHFDVELRPLREQGHATSGVLVLFEDVTELHRLRLELQGSKEELETTNEELQSTNEELETTNEELQSTNEELETTNEELQSTNEELETMNEELQSTNAELQELNTELQLQSSRASRLNIFLRSVQESIHAGVVVVDADFVVQGWNDGATELWGLREDDVMGRSLLDLDIGLPVEELRAPVLGILDESAELQEFFVEAVNRRGARIRCKVTCTVRLDDGNEKLGVVLLMEEDGTQ